MILIFYYLKKLEIDISKIQNISFAIFTQLQFPYNNEMQKEIDIFYISLRKNLVPLNIITG